MKSADITYDVTVSARPDLSDPVISETGVSGTSLTLPADTLEEGTWYWDRCRPYGYRKILHAHE